MHIKYNTEKINRILNDLSVLTGVTIDLIDLKYNIIGMGGKRNPFCLYYQQKSEDKSNCRNCDNYILEECKKSGKLESHICHAGLYDFAMPLKKREILVGYIIFGQIKSTMSPKNYGVGEVQKLYDETPFYSDEKIECLKDLFPQILFENAITLEYDSLVDEIGMYIANNLHKDLSVNGLCKKFSVSKNYLYKVFHQTHNCTINDYVSSVKIKKAQMLLKETKEPIYKIAEIVGVPNDTYFCKLFKIKTGISPSDYRKVSF